MTAGDALTRHPAGEGIDINVAEQLHQIGWIIGVLALAVGTADRDEIAGIVQPGQWKGCCSVRRGHENEIGTNSLQSQFTSR